MPINSHTSDPSYALIVTFCPIYGTAEVCELIGIYMLYLIGEKYNSRNSGLYRDDGLAIEKCKWNSFRKNKKTFTIFLSAKRHANNYRV